jgi:dsRNA-specific ribonuclease
MALYQIHPEYKCVDLKNEFSVELWIGNKMCASMNGTSKKKIEKELAKLVLTEKKYQL